MKSDQTATLAADKHMSAVEAAKREASHSDIVRNLALARLHTAELQIAALSKVNRNTLNTQAPALAQFLDRHLDELKSIRNRTARAIQIYQQNQALDLQRSRAQQIEKGRAKLQQEIEGWSPDVARRIVEAAKALDFSEGEIRAIIDPRMIKALNKARLFDEIHIKHAAATCSCAAQAAKPVSGSKSPANHDPARMSTAEWMRWRANNLLERK
jgi:hypothetical protein